MSEWVKALLLACIVVAGLHITVNHARLLTLSLIFSRAMSAGFMTLGLSMKLLIKVIGTAARPMPPKKTKQNHPAKPVKATVYTAKEQVKISQVWIVDVGRSDVKIHVESFRFVLCHERLHRGELVSLNG